MTDQRDRDDLVAREPGRWSEDIAPIFDPPAPILVPLADGRGALPVRRVFCIGRNYADHAVEMGGDPNREPPFFFMKPADAVVPLGGRVPYPPKTRDLHHEVELVVALASGGRDISAAGALGHVFGYAVGIDLTRRDLQAEAKKQGRPWDMAKGFDFSAPVSAIRPAAAIGHPERAAISLAVDGRTRQSGDIAQQIWKPAEAIAFLSAHVELKPGDLLFTGTPAGVGAVKRGERMDAKIDGIGELSVTLT